jgi:ATP-dependent DNA helicase RecQ
MASDVEVKSARTKSKSPANDFVMGRLSSTHLATLELYEHGSSVSEIVLERGLSRQTIEGHLYRLQMNGRRVDVSDLISPEQIDYIQDLWRALDQPMRIKMVHSESDGSVNYEQIRYAVCLLNAES